MRLRGRHLRRYRYVRRSCQVGHTVVARSYLSVCLAVCLSGCLFVGVCADGFGPRGYIPTYVTVLYNQLRLRHAGP
jgi:hypothetical protein